MSTQFLHVSLYGLAPRKGEPRWATIAGITQEGARAPGAARHVSYPAEPTLLFGVSPLEVGALATAQAEKARDARGRRLRRDGAVLAAAVLSYPVPRTLVEDRDAPDAADLYGAWRHAALSWCRAQFGDALLSVVEHGDEDYLHLHAYALPALDAQRCLRWEAIHPGRAALKRAEGEGQGKAEARAAYKAAMRSLQDDYHAQLGRLFGHARLGPKRARLARTAHLVARDAERRRLKLEQAFAVERDALRAVLEAQVRREFAAALVEAKLRMGVLAEARATDQDRIDELEAEVASLRGERDESYGR